MKYEKLNGEFDNGNKTACYFSLYCSNRHAGKDEVSHSRTGSPY